MRIQLMRVVQMNNNGPQTNGLAEINPDVEDKHEETRKQDESQTNEDAEHDDDDNDDDQRVALSARLQQHQGPLVCWEWFLPVRSLKVLVVENDDSTRHVVSALLRNCGYEVTAVANGLQAWKILEDLRNHFDLVLTEVVMPCLSGIGLLCKIMNHKTCKNIPVIMMSSHGSMSVVFKCLSKGAVDFLVKPIRKNELKNLWQHVWRKCHSSSGSGSESVVRTQKFTKSKGAEESDNNIGSSDEDDIASVGPNARDGSDHGSGTQSSWSWTARAIEVDSPKPMSPQDQAAAPFDSTYAQVMHARPEALGNKCVPVNTTKECDGKDADLGNVVGGKDLEIGVPKIPNFQPEQPSERVSAKVVDNNGEKLPESVSKKDVEAAEKARVELRVEKPNGESGNQPIDIAGMNTDSTDPNTVFDIPSYLFKVSNREDKAIGESEDTPCLELSLKRLRDVADIGNGAKDRNVLRHSDISAFSRYSSGSTANQAPTKNMGSCSPLDNSSDAVKTDSIQNFQSNSNSTPPNQLSNGSSNNDNMGSTTKNVFNKPLIISDKHALKSTVKVSHPSSAFQAVHSVDMLFPQPVKGDVTIANNILTEARDKNQQVQVEHHYHHHHHHHVYNMQQQQQLGNYDSLARKNMAAAAPQCGSSNMLSSHINSATRSYSLSRSASGSNYGSNGLNDSNVAPNPNGTNAEIDNGATGEAKAVCGIGNRAAVDQHRLTHREAALNKFRQKRKARCFEKKVRYQSRKKLAEQRPRIRGQFVRQAATRENKGRDALS